jgi:hypothetical protein
MIRKIWDQGSAEYDSFFDQVATNAWTAWIEDADAVTSTKVSYKRDAYDVMDAIKWEERFHCKPIVVNENLWAGLKFTDEGAYFLFILEWA